MKNKPRTDLRQAEDKKDLQRAATEGKCNFTNTSLPEFSCVAPNPVFVLDRTIPF